MSYQEEASYARKCTRAPLISKISSKDIPPKLLQVAFFVFEPPDSDSRNPAGRNTDQLQLAGLLDFLSYSPCITSHGAGNAMSPSGWRAASLTRRALCSALCAASGFGSHCSCRLRLGFRMCRYNARDIVARVSSVTRCRDSGS